MRASFSGNGTFYLDLPNESVLQFYLVLQLRKGESLEIRSRVRVSGLPKDGFWPFAEDKREYAVSRELASKTALCCFGLLPAAIYADALQEEVPEAEWAAQLLREWAKWQEAY